MNIGPVAKPDKKNKKVKKMKMQLFRFMANLEQFGSRIPVAQSVKLAFSITVTFPLTKNKTEIKNL